MNRQNTFSETDGLALFGKVNASISHELKNIMAIISETAGLLGDLADLADSGRPVQPETLKNCANSIIEEIERGFSTIRRMNQFAHSVDKPVAEVDVLSTLELAAHLAGFLSYAGTVRIQPCDAGTPTIATRPFLLQGLFYQTIAKAYEANGTSLELTASVAPESEMGWEVAFGGIGPETTDKIVDDQIKRLCAAVQAEITADGPSGRITIVLPLEIVSGT